MSFLSADIGDKPLAKKSSFIAYPIELDDPDNSRNLFFSVIAPACFHSDDVSQSIQDSVIECCKSRLMLRQSEATPFDLIKSLEDALACRGLFVCEGHESLMNSHSYGSALLMH